jgi:primary-amine oxidase
LRLPRKDEGGSVVQGVAHPQYFDGAEVNPSGEGRVVKNVICCHEQDNGILWKHTNTPTGRAAVTRQRLLVLQTIITVGNYDYIFAWHFDQAGAIHLESRATGILSTGPIDVGKKSPYGTVVSPGVLGTSHQHFINLRIGESVGRGAYRAYISDPCVDGHNNTITQDDVVTDPPSAENGHGIGFRVKSTPITVSGFADANPLANRSFKIVSMIGLSFADPRPTPT